MSDRLKEIRERLEKATPGPWAIDMPRNGHHAVVSYGGLDRALVPTRNILGTEIENGLSDAEFIAHARQDIPFLLSELERVQAERDDLSGRLDAIEHDYYPEIDELNRLRQALEVARTALAELEQLGRGHELYELGGPDEPLSHQVAREALAEIARVECGKE